MPNLFVSEPGSVQVFNSGSMLPSKIVLIGADMSTNFATSIQNAILTDVGYSQATKQQFMASLSNVIYVYVFGDQMGSVILSGLVFAKRCGYTPAPGDTVEKSGIERVMEFYNTNRASKTSGMVEVTMGSTHIKGFLTELTVSAMSSDIAYLINRFRMTINALPEAGDSDDT